MKLSFLPGQGPLARPPEADLAAAFAALLVELHLEGGGAPEVAQSLRCAAHAASLATSAGHACVLPEELAAQGCNAADLRRTRLVGEGGLATPLVIDPQGRLYLHRYWDYERRLALGLRSLDVPSPLGEAADRAQVLDGLFPARPGQDDDQRLAVAHALERRLTVISGGPGSGKTTTVARLVAACVQLRPDLRIALTAPTGRAAARLQEAIGRLAASDPVLTGIADRLSGAAQTLHRLLGWQPGRRGFRHGPDDPLGCDVLVVDEASMLDLALAARLVDALPEGGRLILVGDRDQLASVEAGAVFGELARTGPGPLSDEAVALLRRSHRFAGGAIGELARAVRDGDLETAQTLLVGGGGSVLGWHELPRHGGAAPLAEALFAGYQDFAAAVATGAAPAQVLAAFERHRVLCAVREGRRGVARVSETLAQRLREHCSVRAEGPWYHGRPVMVSANDYGLRLFNGDVGIALADRSGHLMVHFAGEGGLRAFSPQRLPPCESAFAITVHKAQGSEFDSVDVLLPEDPARGLGRELLYTALTRARDRVAVWGEMAVFAAAAARRTRRASGLAARMSEAAAADPGRS